MLMNSWNNREDAKNGKWNRESGFTLLELTIALAVISTLASWLVSMEAIRAEGVHRAKDSGWHCADRGSPVQLSTG